jgi:YegS/Rv2252/BmrU family lipid kinase
MFGSRDPPLPSRIHVIANPAAGRGAPILHILNSVFRPSGIIWDVSVTQGSGDAARFAAQAVATGVDVVAVYGGDGTVMEVAGSLAGHPTPLAILPGGTANLMAVELGIPRNLTNAARIAVREDSLPRVVDLGKAGDRRFMLRVGIGLEAQKVESTSREMKDRFGMLAYSLGALQALRTSEPARFRLSLDGQQAECEAIACVVDNAGTIGIPGLSHSHQVSVSDGFFDVFALRDLHGLLSGPPRPGRTPAGHRRRAGTEIAQHWRARHITIVTDPPLPVQADGEMWGTTPISIDVLPRAIRVLTKPSPRATSG